MIAPNHGNCRPRSAQTTPKMRAPVQRLAPLQPAADLVKTHGRERRDQRKAERHRDGSRASGRSQASCPEHDQPDQRHRRRRRQSPAAARDGNRRSPRSAPVRMSAASDRLHHRRAGGGTWVSVIAPAPPFSSRRPQSASAPSSLCRPGRALSPRPAPRRGSCRRRPCASVAAMNRSRSPSRTPCVSEVSTLVRRSLTIW